MKYKQALPLNAIKSFEAAARHLSFARAAKDLKVHPPAVSRQVAELERILGVLLFLRSKPRLSLTAQGQELYASVSAGFNEIRQSIERIQHQSEKGLLKVETSIGFASCWLLARLPEFYQRYPEIELQLQTRDSTSNYEPGDTDVSIIFGQPPLPGIDIRTVFLESMITVCAPGFLPGDKLLAAQALDGSNLLSYNERLHIDDWKTLLGSQDLAVPEFRSGQSFNSYIVYLQAILNGDGIGIGWKYLLDDYLDSGRLKIASPLTLKTERGYFCSLQQSASEKPEARLLMDWVCGLVK